MTTKRDSKTTMGTEFDMAIIAEVIDSLSSAGSLVVSVSGKVVKLMLVESKHSRQVLATWRTN
jgi:hypothetical protein